MTQGAGSGRILIVDDEAAHTQALSDALRGQGYETVGVTSGEAALAILRDSRFDLLLAGLTMPGMDGIALLHAARETDADLVGIIMTGEGTITTAMEAMKEGGLDYVLKPFELSMVLPVISRALAMRQLRLANATLERQLQERAAELEAANKELQSFSYSVSHDLRAPLRAIDGYLRMIEEDLGDKLDGVGKRLLDVVCSSSRKMSTMIDSLLALSRVGSQPLHTDEIDMTSLANDVWTEINVGLPPSPREFRLAALPAASGDAALLRQVWSNLLSNAAKYTGKTDAPVIEVSGQVAGKEVIYRVQDNGAGFDMRYYGKLFEVFQRLHSETEFSGTGVGLAIVQRIMTRHGGRLWADAEAGKGATFFFSLPRRDP